jgi:beta-glucosidase
MKKLSYLLLIIVATFSCKTKEVYKDPSLPIEQRVNDLVSRMTLDEKISQMMNSAAAIDRLGIPSYDWWSEGLHGVAAAGEATVFPQAIGLGAIWDSAFVHQVATVISTEFRAKYNDAQSKGDHSRFKGLTVWSPNVNIFRDPRWGRGQETYGEDPYLTGTNGVAFVKGLQGDDPNYLKCVSTPKHYAVHSGPEPLRHKFDANIDMRDFLETYSPQFEMCVREGGAYSVMSAYNRYLGKPCSASDFLLKDVLRERWGFKGYVVSDCDAVADIFNNHKYVKTMAEAAAIAVKTGTDLNCGGAYQALKDAVKEGLITEKEIDVAVKRLFTARFKLGMFDPKDKVPYNKIGIDQNNTKEHRQLALEAARKSIVLLKNENSFLPLKKNLKSIAVIGPNADNINVLYGNYNGVNKNTITVLQGIKNWLPGANIIFTKGCNYADNNPTMDIISSKFLQFNGKNGLQGVYYKGIDFKGKPIATRIDKQINFKSGSFPEGIPEDSFSVRWTGKLVPEKTQEYLLGLTGDDGIRLFLNNKLVIESWIDQPPTEFTTRVKLEKGKSYDVKIEYYQSKGNADVHFDWGFIDADFMKRSIDQASKADVIIMVGGIASSLEGEEMTVNLKGFEGGDRTSINLPDIQEELLKKLKATGKPVVLVLMSGSALAINYAAENIPAIIQAWYPGEEGGNAIADVLFGDYNPAGRLPVTFYKSTKDLPDFLNYKMEGRTYRYFQGTPLYPFGYGLSYTTFKYSNFSVPQTAKAGDKVVVKVDVENTGKMEGDEVAELYVKILNATVPVPIHSLQGYKRVHLKQGEKQTIEFTLTAKQFALVNKAMKRACEPGKYLISVGGCQPGKTEIAKGQAVQGTIELSGRPIILE